MRFRFWWAALILSLVAGCGDGSDSPPKVTPLVYSGSTTQAVIDEQSAESLAAGAFMAATLGSQVSYQDLTEPPPEPAKPLVPVGMLGGALESAFPLHPIAFDPQVRALSVGGPLPGPCGGDVSTSLEEDATSGTFSGKVHFNNYCSEEIVIQGDGSFSGQWEKEDGMPRQFLFTFERLLLTLEGETTTISGTLNWAISYPSRQSAITMDLLMEEPVSSKVFRLDNFQVTSRREGDYLLKEISGRYYDPELGFVNVTTEYPLLITAGSSWPANGRILCRGAALTSVALSFSPAYLFLEADTDGKDGTDWVLRRENYFPRPPNRPPVAVVQPSELYLPAFSWVSLHGWYSYDPDDQALLYSWTLLEKPAESQLSISPPKSENPSLDFLADAPGTFRVSLQVSDGELFSEPVEVVIHSGDPGENETPVAVLQVSATKGLVGTAVRFDASASSDPDGDELHFWWSVKSRPSGSYVYLSNWGNFAELTPDVPGDYVLEVTASDPFGRTASAQATFSAHGPFAAEAGSDQWSTAGAEMVLDGSQSQQGSAETLSYAWVLTQVPPGSEAVIEKQDTAKATLVPDQVGTYVAELTVSGNGEQGTDQVSIFVLPDAALDCTEDLPALLPEQGSLAIGPTRDFVPLCNGWVLYGNRQANAIDLINVVTGTESKRFQLAASPGDLDIDWGSGLLYAALSPATSLARVNLASGEVFGIPTAKGTSGVAVGTGGDVFAALSGSYYTDGSVALVNGPAGTVEKTFSPIPGTFLDYDPSGVRLFVGNNSGTIYRYAFDSATRTITQEETRNAGSNCYEVAVSPDGQHVGIPCGGGNGYGYTIVDFSPDSFSTILGEWNTDSYPSAMAFDKEGQYVAATNGSTLMVFDVVTHRKLKSFPINRGTCSYFTASKVGFSKGGDLVFLQATCGFDDDSGRIYWFKIAPEN